VIERSYPVILVAAAMYKPVHFLGLVTGAGLEYAPEETFTVIRIGLEPSIMGAGVARLF